MIMDPGYMVLLNLKKNLWTGTFDVSILDLTSESVLQYIGDHDCFISTKLSSEVGMISELYF